MRKFLASLLISYSTILYAEPLDELFSQLQNAATMEEAVEVEMKIWDVWQVGPTETATKALQYATASMSKGEYNLALLQLDTLIEVSPEYSEAWNKRATLFYILGNLEASVEDIKETIKLEPRHFGAWSGLGMIFENYGNQTAAIRAFETVISIYPLSQFSKSKLEQLTKEILEKSI